MSKPETEFLQRLRAAFLAEARDHLLAIASGLLALEKATSLAERGEQLETVFRHTHSLKGAARAASFPRIEGICQCLEDVFSLCKRRGRILGSDDFDVLHKAFDLVRTTVDAGGVFPAGASVESAETVIGQLQAMVAGKHPRGLPLPAAVTKPAAKGDVDAVPGAPESEPIAAERAVAAADTIRVATPHLDRVLLAAEELLTLRQAGEQQAAELRWIEGRFEEWSKRWLAAQPAIRRLRNLPGAGEALEFLDWGYDYMRALEGAVRVQARTAVRDSHLAGKQIEELLEDSKNLLMLPFSALSESVPKLVRDLARDQDKEVALQVSGDEVHLDKRMIDLLRDPLVHLVRNAIDHGVEMPARREAAGKPRVAQVRIEARLLHGNRIELEVADDGAGLDPVRLRSSALRSGVVSEEAIGQLDEDEVLDLAFRSDVSTSPIISEISGRGLGLAIVREHVETLGGRVTVKNHAPNGASFSIVLPQSMATLRGLFVEAAGQTFVIPSAHVDRVARAPRSELKTVSRRETLSLDGQAVAVAQLRHLLDLPPEAAGPANAFLTVVLVGSGHQRLAIAVDEVLHDEEILVKRLRKPLLRVRNVSGATVLPSGKPVPILNVSDLLKSARLSAEPTQARAAASAARPLAHRILLAEDSITSRMLLKGILEAAGCEVKAVADGLEAFTALRSESFDLLVSDIEMPRLNGFDLTAMVRADRKLSDLPVVLVTALSRREDRERGIDVGANAYITKSGFDQRELLDAVRRLAIAREPS